MRRCTYSERLWEAPIPITFLIVVIAQMHLQRARVHSPVANLRFPISPLVSFPLRSVPVTAAARALAPASPRTRRRTPWHPSAILPDGPAWHVVVASSRLRPCCRRRLCRCISLQRGPAVVVVVVVILLVTSAMATWLAGAQVD